MAKQYDKKFKLDVINYRKEHPELSVFAVCKNLGISEPTYYDWLKRHLRGITRCLKIFNKKSRYAGETILKLLPKLFF